MKIPHRPAPVPPAVGPPSLPRPAATREADAVTISAEAAIAADGADAPDPLRAARLAKIRAQIAAGTYDTADRLDAALDSLLADLAE